ncbi:YfcC family protein [uncultured Tateyamaria sp.]|uniref:YfcC family protein n=1 Tax=uncultured Tateyamaria sp. TaxID=455651 RepID=UPI00261A7C29|nr:YfcC family protein [uncultured Tateyamaria sp.]
MKLKFPTAYTILFALIALVAIATWFVPAGEYERVANEALGRDVPVPGTYETVEPNPQGIIDVFLAPIAGFYDPGSYEAQAIDVSLFVLVIGGFLAVVTKTGAIDAGIGTAMRRLKGREKWMIPIMMALFAAGGTIYGMAEESLAFYALIIPVMIAAGYDALTGVAIIMLGAGVGTLGSTINPFATVIASDAAGVPFTDGINLRLALLVACWLACVGYVMRYAARVRAEPGRSVVADLEETNKTHFLKSSGGDEIAFTGRHKIILVVFAASFGVMIWGVSAGGWWMAEMSALFLVAALIIGVIDWMGEEAFVTTFVDGARDLLGVALIIGIARGIVVVMDAGNMTDTVLFWAEGAVEGLGEVAFINTMFGLQAGLSFLVPSSSGLAVLTMPIMAPLGDFSDVERSLVVTAYQSASGLVNLITPTSAVVMGGLALGRVPYDRWIRFMVPLLILLSAIIMVGLSIATMG